MQRQRWIHSRPSISRALESYDLTVAIEPFAQYGTLTRANSLPFNSWYSILRYSKSLGCLRLVVRPATKSSKLKLGLGSWLADREHVQLRDKVR